MSSRALSTSKDEPASVAAATVFMSTAELRERLLGPESERPRLLDARVERQYLAGHLPGAFNLPARELNPIEKGVRRLVRREELYRSAGWLGDARELVLYGARGGADAAHVWWTLRAFGLERARLLDGGVEAWQEEGGALVAGPGQQPGGQETARPGDVPPSEPRPDDAAADEERFGETDHDHLISAEELLRRLDDPDVAIVDTREPEEFSGELVAAGRGGHVPGSSLFPWTSALEPDLRLRPEAELRELLAPVLEKPEAIVYCQSGVRAAHTLAVLEMLGHPRARLYLGSWGEWGNRDDTPVEVEAKR